MLKITAGDVLFMDGSALRYKEACSFMPGLIRTKSDRAGPASQRPHVGVCVRVWASQLQKCINW